VRFESLIEQYHDEIFSYLWRMTDHGGQVDHLVDPQDLTQEVFLRAYGSFGRLRPDSNYRAWLYKIATNCAYTALKRGRRTGQNLPIPEDDGILPAPVDTAPSPYEKVVQRETLSSLKLALAGLPVKQQAAVVMRHVQGLDYAEISQALNCSEDSARANVYQALRRLRHELGPDEQNYLDWEVGK
jgi:RNA polymerase sigma-70 factor (ECF subfamily)